MAKKTSKKSKPAKKPPAKKSASKKGAKKAAPKRNPMMPVPISTGGGADPMEVGTNLVRMFNSGQMAGGEIEKKYWSPKIVSIEGVGVSMGWHGAKAATAKGEEWMMDNIIHSASAEGPYVGATGFAVKYTMDVETKSTGQRKTMVEVGVYSVLKGKIVQEEFMYYCG
ncbi:MAG: SnoaL-like domain-containing protein [Phycisphaerales bacterium]